MKKRKICNYIYYEVNNKGGKQYIFTFNALECVVERRAVYYVETKRNGKLIVNCYYRIAHEYIK